ncbi:MAG: amino acid adenylation domain-containing protein, partial [Jatrophihabitantaceae bacterium]
AAVPLPLIELAEPDPAEPELAEAVRRLAADQAVLPFDLDTGPLFRLQLVRLAVAEHALIMVMHHSIFDAWSLGVFLRELTALYDAELAGRPPQLTELPIQLGDLVLWERQRLAEPAAELIGYWRQALAGAPTLELATDRPRPARESFRGQVQWLNLGSELLAELRSLSRDEGSTLFTTLLTGLHALLARYTGQRDIVIGAPSANRGRDELSGLIGFLVNTLPIRADLTGDPSFSQLLRQVHSATVSAYAHQDLPFARLVDTLQVPRDPGRSPVFQVVLTFADQAEPFSAEGLSVRVEKVDLPAAKFELNFYAEVRPDGLWVELAYASDLFEAATISRMLAHYGRLLAGAAADPSRRLSELPLLSEPELHRELIEYNDTAAELPTGTLTELFQAQVRRSPDAIAAVQDGAQLSYRELNARSNQLAGLLVELGVAPEVLVGISMQPSIDRLVALLAVLKAGGGYLPLDPALPPDRLAFMIADAGLALSLTDPDSAAALAPLPVRSLVLPELSGELASRPDGDLAPIPDPSAVAYVLYTSGSTGQPKGVQVEHRNAVNFVTGQLAHWQLDGTDSVLQYASLNFDVSVLDLFAALLSGARLVLASQPVKQSPLRLAALMREHRVSFASLPPAVLNLLTDQDFPDLRVLISAGEELRTDLARSWLRPGLRLVNGYGPTETTVLSAFAEIDESLLPPPIGRPPANYQAYVLDAELNPVPLGAIGELHTGGAGVARGYLNRPELTAQRFISDPFSTDPRARLYKTGDLVRRRANGNLDFVGRIDGQVKVRGLRVELGEIEAALANLPGVAQAVVNLDLDPAGEHRLIGYLRRAPGSTDELDPGWCKQQLGRWLPAYMVPAQLLVLDSFPLNASGKVDKHALPSASSGAGLDAIVAPSTLIETMLVEIYAGVLKLDQLSVEASFFDAGGNSLQAMRLIGQVADELGVEVAVADIFLAPRPRELARLLCAEHGLRDAELGADGLASLTDLASAE